MPLLNVFIFILISQLAIASLLYCNHLHVKKANKLKQLQGLAWLSTFRHLLTAIQQHRGLSMGILNGDNSLSARITPLEEDINNQFISIESKEGWLTDNLTWLGISDHWLRLSNNYKKYGSAHNFTQHCHLIINLLNLIEECADNHHLQELTCSNKQNANFLWTQLLNTAEYIGQARAIGTSIAAAKKSGSLQRIKLNYLQNCINEFLAQPNQQLDTKLVAELLTTIDKNILCDRPNISAEAFFDLATSVLDSLLGLFDYYLDELQETLICTVKTGPEEITKSTVRL